MIIGQVPISTAPTSTFSTGSWADTVPAERTVYVVGESRTLLVPAKPDYSMIVPAVQKTIKISADRDTISIRESV